MKEFVYRMSGTVRGPRPGFHRSPGGDQGMEFRGHARLMDSPDARRLDLRASLLDPLALLAGQYLVRLHAQRKAIDVTLVADLSASMAFEGRSSRREVLASFAETLAWSAWRLGDRFAFVGCDEKVLTTPRVLPSRAMGLGPPLGQALRGHRAADGRGRGAQGLLQVPSHLGQRRGLVFLVSDFHLDDALIGRVLDGLALHDVVPVVTWDRDEFAPTNAGGRGLMMLRDPEDGSRRLLWWRPALRERFETARAARRESLSRLFRAHRLRPLFIEGAFDADAVSRHFQQ